MPKKLKFEDVRARIEKRGFTLLSEDYIDSKTKLQVVCPNGHSIWKRFNDIDQGLGCLECSGLAPRTLQEAQDLAAVHGGECLDSEYVNSRTKMHWRCKYGHPLSMTFDHVKKGHWCRVCNNNLNHRITWPQFYEMCASKGGTLLVDMSGYPSRYAPVPIRCGVGHQFTQTFGHIAYEGTWCPDCRRSVRHNNNKSQTECFEICKLYAPDALQNQTGLLPSPLLELDIWMPSLRKAVEFDGEYWHQDSEVQERDARKEAECRQVGIELLRVGYRKHWRDGRRQRFGEKMVVDFLQSKPLDASTSDMVDLPPCPTTTSRT